MNMERWVELGLPEKAFRDLHFSFLASNVQPTELNNFVFALKRRIWGQYYTLIAQWEDKGSRYVWPREYEIIRIKDRMEAEHVLMLLAVEGLRVKV